MLTNSLAQGTTCFLNNILPVNQSTFTFSQKVINFEDTTVKFQEFKDSKTLDLMVRFDNAVRFGEKLSNKLGLNEEQIIQFCLEDE